MPCPTPSDFNDLIVSLEAPVCEQLRKLGQLSKAVSDAYSCIYNENLTFTEAFAQKICATGCGGDVASTTPGGGTSTTTTASAPTNQDFEVPGSYIFTVPAGVTSITINAVGGGGGGGCRGSAYAPACPSPSTNPWRASGGGSGQRRIRTIAVVPLSTINIVVGNAGSASGYGQGTDGSLSSATSGVTVVAGAAGRGGYAGCCFDGPFPGGAGGTGGSGGTSENGNPGGPTIVGGCVNGAAGVSVSNWGNWGAGSAGNPLAETNPATGGAVRLTW